MWPTTPSAGRIKLFRIYRWNPDEGGSPRIDVFPLDLDQCGPMILDALIKIKNDVDSTLTFRRSCREGVCGSCAMSINGRNWLACIQPIEAIEEDVCVVRGFRPTRRRAAAIDRRTRQPRRLLGVHPVFLLHQRCPSCLWNGDRYLGPAVLLQAWCWIADSRDEAN